MKKCFFLAVIFIIFPVSVCFAGAIGESISTEHQDIIRLELSDCKDDADIMDPEYRKVNVESEYIETDRKLVLIFTNIKFNCCPSVVLSLDKTQDHLFFSYTDPGNCECMCAYDLIIEIADIEKKYYDIEFLNSGKNKANPEIVFKIDPDYSLKTRFEFTR